MTDHEQENRKVYERHLAWVRATYPEDYERYLAAIEEVRLTGQNPYDEADRELDEWIEALRAAPVHPPRGRGEPVPPTLPTPEPKH